MRTYQPLPIGVYYRPKDAYIMYYSTFYGVTYYNGYGWNFYTKRGGYYDCAINWQGEIPTHCNFAPSVDVAPTQLFAAAESAYSDYKRRTMNYEEDDGYNNVTKNGI